MSDPTAATEEPARIRPYDGTWDPNWAIYKIYSVVDVLNSPMRAQILEHEAKKKAKKERRRREMEAAIAEFQRQQQLLRQYQVSAAVPGSVAIEAGNQASPKS